MNSTITYRGRFAPSPTGPLHFGSLVAALGSYLDARACNGEWLIRMEDVDLPRCVAGADEQILNTLEAFGFEWDGEVVYQSRRIGLYREAFDRLTANGLTFPCACTRKQLAGGGTAIDGGQRYDGRCRNGLPSGATPRAWRVRVPETEIRFDDAIQGELTQQLQRDVGDFVVLRADGLFAYQLAVVVDDAGLKLSKQTLAAPVDAAQPLTALQAAWRFLGQSWEGRGAPQSVDEFWNAAIRHWQIGRVPRQRTLPAPIYSRSSLPP